MAPSLGCSYSLGGAGGHLPGHADAPPPYLQHIFQACPEGGHLLRCALAQQVQEGQPDVLPAVGGGDRLVRLA